MVAGHSVIGNELMEFTLDDSGATAAWLETETTRLLVGISWVGQQTPLSQGRCCKRKVQEASLRANEKCNIMDAADMQPLNTHHQPDVPVEFKILTWTILSWIPP